MKKCFKCGKEKPLSEFYAHKQMGDGHLNKCKTCTKIDVGMHYQKMMQDPTWIAKERERQRIKERSRRALGKQSPTKPENKNAWRKRNAIKGRAHLRVGRAVRKGALLRQACEVCGHPKAQAHHDDYNEPLNVRWLCTAHHAEHHVNQRRKQLFQKDILIVTPELRRSEAKPNKLVGFSQTAVKTFV
jgi:hypothetical protein